MNTKQFYHTFDNLCFIFRKFIIFILQLVTYKRANQHDHLILFSKD